MMTSLRHNAAPTPRPMEMSMELGDMPGYSAVSAAMQEAADKAADGSGKVADVFPVAQQTSIDTLKNYGLSVAK